MRTVACEIGSKHPFIKSADAVDFKENLIHQGVWRELKEDDNQEGSDLDSSQDAMVALFKEIEPFLLDGTELGGAQVTYAKKAMEIGPDISQDGNASRISKVDVHAYGIRDIHDKKKAVKDMRFFSTGGRDNETACVWVAMEKNKANIHKNVLFSNTKASSARAFVKTELLLNCRSLTVKDKTADWFVLRRFRMMGTMGAMLSSRVLHEENDIKRDTELAAIMDNCIKQWFGRHKSTEAMKQGSANEPMILQRLQTFDWIEAVFEVGMLQ